MTSPSQNTPFTPVFAPQAAYLAVEQPPTDEAEAQRLVQLRQLLQAAPEVADLRDFATQAREVMGEGYTIHSGSSHIWLKRDDQAGRLAIIADRYTTRYCDWNAPSPVLVGAGPESTVARLEPRSREAVMLLKIHRFQ